MVEEDSPDFKSNHIEKQVEKGIVKAVDKIARQEITGRKNGRKRKRIKNKKIDANEKAVKGDSPDFNSNHIEKQVEKDSNEYLNSKRLFSSSVAFFFIVLTFVSIILFLLAGYAYPATYDDMTNNKIFWFINNGNFDRGLFTEFYAAFIFTMCVFLLGFYVNSTFVRYGIESWAIFSIGIYLMFLYGLGKIGELTFNHALFEEFKDLILPVALTISAYALFRIFEDLKGEKLHGS